MYHKTSMIVFLLILLFSSCATDPAGNTISSSAVLPVAGPRIYSDSIFTAAGVTGSLTMCFNEVGESFHIRSDDLFRILFFDTSNKSYEKIIPAPATLGDLLSQISSAAAVAGAVIAIAPDTLGEGELMVTASGAIIQNLSVTNTTNSYSSGFMTKTFRWANRVETGNSAASACLMFAERSAPLLSLRSKKGELLGIEMGDTIHVEGRTPAGLIDRTHVLAVDSTMPTLNSLISLIGSTVSGSTVSMGDPTVSAEAGKIILELPDELSNYAVRLTASNSNSNYVTTSKFNTTFLFRP